MPKFETTINGERYTVEAPDLNSAADAFRAEYRRMERERVDEKLASRPTREQLNEGLLATVLESGLAGLGTEAMAAYQAGTLNPASDLFQKELADVEAAKSAFEQKNPNFSTVLGVGAALAPSSLAAKAGLGAARALSGGAQATRSANAAALGTAGLAEGGLYAIGSKQGSLEDRLDEFDVGDAVFMGLAGVAGLTGGALVKGRSRPLSEVVPEARERLALAMTPTTAGLGVATSRAADVGADIAAVAYDAVSTAFPVIRPAAEATGSTAANLTEAVRAASSRARGALEMSPRASAILERGDAALQFSATGWGMARRKFDKAFQPVAEFAEKYVDKTFGASLARGGVNGVRAQNRVEQLFAGDDVARLRGIAQTNPTVSAALADYSNIQLTGKQRRTALNTLRNQLGGEDFNRLQRFWKAQEKELNSIAAGTQTADRTYGFMHILADRERGMGRRQGVEGAAEETFEAADSALRQRKAGEGARVSTADASARARLDVARLSEDGSALSRYGAENPILNPFESHQRVMKSRAMVAELAKAQNLRAATSAADMEALAKGTFHVDQLADQLAARGLSQRQIEDAQEVFIQTAFGSQRAMSRGAQVIRNLGYATTIANPYGAVLQIHDLFNAAAKDGAGHVFASLAKTNGFDITIKDVDLLNQILTESVQKAGRTGRMSEEAAFMFDMAERSERLLDLSMKYSGFAALDRMSKGKIMSSALGREFDDLASNPSAWAEKWQYTFNRPGELDSLARALRAKDMNNPLVQELATLNLAKLQPIGPTSSSLFQLSNPNWRLAYMLKGFAIKQLQFVRENIIGQLKTPGKRKEGLRNLVAYMMLSGGGYGLVNETRQIVKGEMPDYANIPTLATYQLLSVGTLGAFGATDYGAEMFRRDPYGATVSNFIPAAPLAQNAAKDVSDLITKGDPIPDRTAKTLPLVGPLFRAVDKLSSGEED